MNTRDERPLPPRLAREAGTVDAMIRIYCRAHHLEGASHDGALCDACRELSDYAHARLSHCPFREEKPTCANCPIHCYQPEMRERVRKVMRFAGPRMMLHHPILAIRHLLDGRREAPPLGKSKK